MNIQANSLLKQAEKIIEKYDAIDKAIGGKFNIFSVLNIERYEVKTHSLFIYDFINPQGSHVQGETYFSLFVEKVLEIESFNRTNLKVKREDPTTENRRIDFTIENDHYLIAIEMKIDAIDQSQQLVDYARHINEHAKKLGKKAKVYYLTLDGKEASKASTHDEEDKVVEYERISFATHILEWIDGCIAQSATLPTVRETLVQYAKLLRKITNQNEVTMDNELVELLLKDGNLVTAEKIKNALLEARARLELKFWRKVEKLLKEEVGHYGFEMREFTDDELIGAIKGRNKGGESFVEFYDSRQYFEEKYFNFGICADGYNNQFYILFYPFNKNWEYLNENDRKKCVKDLDFPFKKKEYYEYFGNKRDFYGDGLFELVDPSKCDEMVEETVQELIPYLEILQQRINTYFENNKPLR